MKRAAAHILLLLAAVAAHAQSIDVTARTDSAGYRIGDWIRLRLESRAPKEYRQILPVLKDSVGRFEIVSAGETAEEESGDLRICRRDITLIAFDTGACAVPPLTVTVIKPNDTTHYRYSSQPVHLTIRGVEVDTTKPFRDITDVLHIPLTVWDYLLYVGLLLAAAALVYAGYRWYTRKPAPAAAPEPEPDIPPHAAALEALAALEQQHLWERGEDKRYQSELTEILRQYIERRYRIRALEMTTNELIPHLVFAGIGRAEIEGLNGLLTRADLTKFAKHHPSPQEHQAAMAGARRFVEATAADFGIPAPRIGEQGEGASHV